MMMNGRAVIRKKSLWLETVKRNRMLYLMLLPGLMYLVLMKYIPYLGSVLAFKTYDPMAGSNLLQIIANSPWAGLDNFKRIFARPDSLIAVKNTFVLIGLKLLILFPLPILLATGINEVRSKLARRSIQTIIYFPHFLSWVVVSSLFLQLLYSGGFVSKWAAALQITLPSFFTDGNAFRWLLIFTDGWRNAGYGTIVYLAAMTAIDPALYEAAVVDGAGRLRRIWSITLPSITPQIVLLLVLNIGQQMAFGSFEQVLSMYNPAVYNTSDIIQTFTYRIGLGRLDYSFATAVGLLNAIVASTFVFASNAILKKTLGRSIW